MFRIEIAEGISWRRVFPPLRMERCTAILKAYEYTWHRAGRWIDKETEKEAVKLHDFRNRQRDSTRFSVSERNGVDSKGAYTKSVAAGAFATRTIIQK